MKTYVGDSSVNSEKKKSNNKPDRKRIKILPRYCEDALGEISDDDLRSIFYVIRSVVMKGKRDKKDVRSREIDLCYIQRECQFRKLRVN